MAVRLSASSESFPAGRPNRRLRWSVVLATALLLPAAFHAPAPAADDPIAPAGSVRETTPVDTTGDAMDDPAVWVHPTDPSRSPAMENDKGGAFETYDLDGTLVQRLSFGYVIFWGNVDVRQGGDDRWPDAGHRGCRPAWRSVLQRQPDHPAG